MRLRPLTDAQKALPYAKYYTQEMAPPNPASLAELDKGPMNPDKALPLEEINRLLDSGYHEAENGYCIMKNDLGYVAVNSVFPNVTVDMMRWWFVWHAAGIGLRYRIWNPKKHVAIAVADRDLRKLQDPNVPLSEKIVDVSHFVVEDIGGGEEDVVISFKRVPDMGFDMEKY
jgi:hypothetical protein